MHARLLSLLCAGAFAGSLLSTHNAAAQQPADTAEPGADNTATPDTAAPPPADATGATNQEALVADAEEGNSPLEHPGQVYRFVGLRYRGIIVPKFMMNLFGDGGRTVYVNDFVPSSRSARTASSTTSPRPSVVPHESDAVQSELRRRGRLGDRDQQPQDDPAHGRFPFEHRLQPQFALNYGLGAGFGIVFGDLHRVQAYKNAGGSYVPCVGRAIRARAAPRAPVPRPIAVATTTTTATTRRRAGPTVVPSRSSSPGSRSRPASVSSRQSSSWRGSTRVRHQRLLRRARRRLRTLRARGPVRSSSFRIATSPVGARQRRWR